MWIKSLEILNPYEALFWKVISMKDNRFWIVYMKLKDKYPVWSSKKLMYVTRKLVKR